MDNASIEEHKHNLQEESVLSISRLPQDISNQIYSYLGDYKGNMPLVL